MELKSDFYNDWLDILEDILHNTWGYDISSVSRDNLPGVFFNAQERRPHARARVVKTADTFSCPDDKLAGWERLQDIVTQGGDITPNLSTLVDKIDKYDPMLIDWGVHHFHLGENMKESGNFIERTGPLLFAFVTDDAFHAINVYSHGDWTNKEIVETIHRNWPDVIASSKRRGIIKSSSEDITDEQRAILRSKNGNATVTVADGTTYRGMGGGSTLAGNSVNSSMQTIRTKKIIQGLEDDLQSNLGDYKEAFEKCGYVDDEIVEANLSIRGHNYVAIFPKYSLEIVFST